MGLKLVVKGEVSLYLTDEYPHDVKFEDLKGESEMVVIIKVVVVGNIAPIWNIAAQKFSNIKSESGLHTQNTS